MIEIFNLNYINEIFNSDFLLIYFLVFYIFIYTKKNFNLKSNSFSDEFSLFHPLLCIFLIGLYIFKSIFEEFKIAEFILFYLVYLFILKSIYLLFTSLFYRIFLKALKVNKIPTENFSKIYLLLLGYFSSLIIITIYLYTENIFFAIFFIFLNFFLEIVYRLKKIENIHKKQMEKINNFLNRK